MRVKLGFDSDFDWIVGEAADNSTETHSDRDPHQARKLLAILRDVEDQVADRFIIIERSGQHFMQCLCEDNGWLLEKREGGAKSHWRARVRVDTDPAIQTTSIAERIFSPARHPSLLLSFEQVSEAVGRYLAYQPEPAWLDWEKIEV